VTLIGLILGVVASVWLSRWIAALLFGLEPRDPVTLAAAAALVMAVAVVAAWLPARRALRVNLANLLRDA
jgi:ABC-type antimicrobial peptide transport system permease subunit